MDIEECVDHIIDALREADKNQWDACYYAFEASVSGYPQWAELIAQSCSIGTDQVRNKASAWSMYLILLDESKFADVVREGLYTSHFYTAYKYAKTDTCSTVEALIQAFEEGLSVRQLAALLETILGDDPAGKYSARLGRFDKELRYLYSLSEFYNVQDPIRKAMKELIYWLGHEA